MDTPKRSWHTAPRSALRNVSNAQSASIRGSSSFDRHETPTKESQGVLSASAKRINLSVRRALSKSHGNLSNLRPKSPPIQNLPAALHGLHLSPGNYIDDTQSFFSPSYNRQARQAIPNDWMTSVSGTQPPKATEGSASASQQNYQNPAYGRLDSHHLEVEPATISIQGLTSRYIQPLDFCVPATRFHPGDENQRREALHGDTGRSLTVEHINVSTAWNGLSDVDANELFRVHQAFVSTLEKMLANEVWQIYQQLQQQDSAGNISPIHTLFSTGIVRGISFCRDQLVSEMADALYSSQENMAEAKSGFLRLYLIATDALVQHHGDGSRDTSITIRVRCDPLSLRLHPVVDAAWVPDSLMFEGLDEFPLEGQSFSIVPRYYSKSAFRPNPFPKNVKYSIESESRKSPLSWLAWDDEIAGFKGIVPFYSEVNGYDRNLASTCRDPYESISNTLKFVVRAVLIDDNGSSVRYERILRARLTIMVVPWYANNNSRETNESSSLPKAYQDTRLASAAQRFALQGPRGSLLKPGQSLGRPSQRGRGGYTHTPQGYAHRAQIGFRDDHSAMSSPATEAGLRETDLPDQAQTQAQLVDKCAELTRELEIVKEQIMMSDPFGDHHSRMLQVPDSQGHLNDTYRVPCCHHAGHNVPTSGSSDPRISHYASEHVTASLSSSLNGRDATSHPGANARSSVLPPPAIDITTRPTLDSPTLNRYVLDATRNCRYSTLAPSTNTQLAARGEGLTTHDIYSTQVSDYIWPFLGQASTSLNNTDTAHSSPRQRVEVLTTPPMVKAELATLSTSGKRGLKRRARSSLSVNKRSPLKRSKETEKQLKQEMGAHSAEPGRNTLPLLDPEDEESSSPTQWSSGIFYNSFGPLSNLRSSSPLAGEDALALHASEREPSTNSEENIKHRNQCSGCYMDIENTDSDELDDKTSPVSSGLGDGATAADNVPSNSIFSHCKGQGRVRERSSASFSPRGASHSASSGSLSGSSNVEFVVEQDPRARKVSRREQAKLWKRLSQSDNAKENQSGPEGKEVRLSEDEKKAMDEAMQRSLDDLAGGFDNIFLEDSSESDLGDDL